MILGEAKEQGLGTVQFLNVIFHGPFNFIFHDSTIDVVTVDTDEHLFAAGTFMEEKMIDTGSYKLDVPSQKPSGNKLGNDRYLSWSANEFGMNVPNNCYKFILPYPYYNIQPFSLMSAKGGGSINSIFNGTHAGRVTASKLGAVHAITYQISTVNSVQLEGVSWVPKASLWYPAKAVNLHIFAEAAFPPDSSHAIRDFDRHVSMLPKLQLGIKPYPESKVDIDEGKDDDDFGIKACEQVGLRGITPPPSPEFSPPAICDAPSMMITP